MTFSAAERRQLAELFLEVGPDAPTLCEGWVTRDLAAHLHVRENSPLAAAGMFVGPLKSRLSKAMDAQRDRDFEVVVGEWAAGPSSRSPMRFADGTVNTGEHFIHHEDVRRGDGVARPREFSQAAKDLLAGQVKQMAKMSLKGSSKPVVLTAPGAAPIVVGGGRGVAERGDDVVRVSGEVGELLLWVSGRDVAEVVVEGDLSALNR